MSQFRARLRVSLTDVKTGAPIVPDQNRDYGSLKHIIGPGEIELRPGESYRKLVIPHPLSTYPSVAQDRTVLLPRSLLVLATDTPGVMYSLGTGAPSTNALSTPRLLADFKDAPFQVTLQADTPNYDPVTPRYIDSQATTTVGPTVQYLRLKRVTDQIVKYGGWTGYIPSDLNGFDFPFGESRYMWGRDNKVNLGSLTDNLVFCFWINRNIGGSTAWLTLLSYPYRPNTKESDLSATAGTPTDANMIKEMFPGETQIANEPFSYAEISGFAAGVTDDRWRFVQVRKQDFTHNEMGTGQTIDMERITWMSVASGSLGGTTGLGTGIHFGPIFLMQEAMNFRRLDTAAIETILWDGENTDDYQNRDSVNLILTAPPDRTAKVKYFLGIG